LEIDQSHDAAAVRIEHGGTGHPAFGSAVLGDVREPQCIRAVRVEAALNQIVPGRPHLAVMPPAAPMHPLQAGDPHQPGHAFVRQ
jgi:hypothetical protein